jgi:hypothetical protein
MCVIFGAAASRAGSTRTYHTQATLSPVARAGHPAPVSYPNFGPMVHGATNAAAPPATTPYAIRPTAVRNRRNGALLLDRVTERLDAGRRNGEGSDQLPRDRRLPIPGERASPTPLLVSAAGHTMVAEYFELQRRQRREDTSRSSPLCSMQHITDSSTWCRYGRSTGSTLRKWQRRLNTCTDSRLRCHVAQPLPAGDADRRRLRPVTPCWPSSSR